MLSRLGGYDGWVQDWRLNGEWIVLTHLGERRSQADCQLLLDFTPRLLKHRVAVGVGEVASPWPGPQALVVSDVAGMLSGEDVIPEFVWPVAELFP